LGSESSGRKIKRRQGIEDREALGAKIDAIGEKIQTTRVSRQRG